MQFLEQEYPMQRVLILFLALFLLFANRADADGSTDVGSYRRDVSRRVLKSTKSLNAESYGTKTVVDFTIYRDGSLHDLYISRRSDSAENDALALASVRRCAPFPKMPKDVIPSACCGDFVQNVSCTTNL
jgi:TonB family protein